MIRTFIFKCYYNYFPVKIYLYSVDYLEAILFVKFIFSKPIFLLKSRPNCIDLFSINSKDNTAKIKATTNFKIKESAGDKVECHKNHLKTGT